MEKFEQREHNKKNKITKLVRSIEFAHRQVYASVNQPSRLRREGSMCVMIQEPFGQFSNHFWTIFEPLLKHFWTINGLFFDQF